MARHSGVVTQDADYFPFSFGYNPDTYEEITMSREEVDTRLSHISTDWGVLKDAHGGAAAFRPVLLAYAGIGLAMIAEFAGAADGWGSDPERLGGGPDRLQLGHGQRFGLASKHPAEYLAPAQWVRPAFHVVNLCGWGEPKSVADGRGKIPRDDWPVVRVGPDPVGCPQHHPATHSATGQRRREATAPVVCTFRDLVRSLW